MKPPPDYITMVQAAQALPGNPSQATLSRWATRGITRKGRLYRLRRIRVGGRVYTTAAWIAEFAAALVDADIQADAIRHPHRRPRLRQIPSHERDAHELQEQGL